MTLHELWQVYYVFATFLTFYGCLRLPTQLDRVGNVTGSLLVAMVLGWLIWPFVLVAVRRSQL